MREILLLRLINDERSETRRDRILSNLSIAILLCVAVLLLKNRNREAL